MALIKEKTVLLVGRSVINNVEVARFNANIATNDDSMTTTNTTVNNVEAYRKNIRQVRKDADEFQAYVRKVEDEAFTDDSEDAASGSVNTNSSTASSADIVAISADSMLNPADSAASTANSTASPVDSAASTNGSAANSADSAVG